MAPWLAVGAKSIASPFCRAEEEAVGLPWYNATTHMSARYSSEGLKWGEKAAANAGRMTRPLLLLHAKDDRMTDFRGSQLLMERAATDDKTLIDDLDGRDHALVHGDTSELECKYIRKVVAWLDARV